MYVMFLCICGMLCKRAKEILLEGQLSSSERIRITEIYPMVTSSSPSLAAHGAIGAGLPPVRIKYEVHHRVRKAYSSAVERVHLSVRDFRGRG
ncbi:MAG: adenylosuccinate synthetase [Mediterraneibacter gnavus]